MRVRHWTAIITCVSAHLLTGIGARAGDLKPYPLPPETSAEIEKLAARSDILILGETHGTQDVPEFVATLLAPLTKLGYGTLALEVPINFQATLRAWARGETESMPDFFVHPNGDGIANAQLLALARVAASPRFQWQLVCFDHSELPLERDARLGALSKSQAEAIASEFTEDKMIAHWCDRDAQMATNALSETKSLKPTSKILVICGDLHARTTNDIKEPPMITKLWPSFAGHLKQRAPAWQVHSVKIEFAGGSYFNGGKVQTLPKRPLEHAVVRPSGENGYDLVLDLPPARPATLVGQLAGARK